MKPTANPKGNCWHVLAVCVVLSACLGLIAGCSGPAGPQAPPAPPASEPVAQVTGCGWTVWRYDTFNKAWASISNLLNLDRLLGKKGTLLCSGYVATDSTGQSCLSRSQEPKCVQAWVWQKGSWVFGADEISACAKGSTSAACSASSTATFKACAVKIVTKPAKITVKGTIVTVADDQDMQLTLVIVHEGGADIEAATAPDAPVTLETGQAAYFVSPEITQDQLDQVTNELGFPPNQPVPIDLIFPLVERMQLVPQIQRANAVVLGEGDIVLLPVPFAWSLRSVEEQISQDLANELAVAWRSAVRWEDRPDSPIVYEAWLDQDIPFIRQLAGPDVSVPDGANYDDLRGIPSNADVGPLQEALKNAGYDTSKEVVLLVAEESVEELGPIADWIANQLNDLGLPAITQSVNSEAMEGVLSELRAEEKPVFLLTWY